MANTCPPAAFRLESLFTMKKFLKSISAVKSKLGKWFWVFVVVGLVVLAVLVFLKKSKGQVLTAVVQKGEIKEELILSGQIDADKHAVLYFPTSGKISWVGVKEGDPVKKGQALTSLDKTVLNTAYQQALNNYKNYQASAENVLDSVKNHESDETFAQKATRTAAEVTRDNAYDSVKAAEYNLRNATITAPFDGVVTMLPFPNPGINVMATEPQVEIIDPVSIYFAVDADQSEVVEIKNGQNVVIELDSHEGEIQGKVVFISFTPKKGEVGTVYKVKIVFENLDQNKNLRVGMTGDARFVLAQKSDALFVPSRFVNSDKDGKYVLLGKDNKVYIKTGIEGEESTEIIEGVSEGDVLYD